MDNIFDSLINIILKSKKELRIKVFSQNLIDVIPRVYYVGDGKTGSSSIKNGFITTNTAHWHDVKHFENIYNTKLLTNNKLDLYDLIFYIGRKYNFLPIIIESIRNPINKEISNFFQHYKDNSFSHGNNCSICNYKNCKNINDKIQYCNRYMTDKIKGFNLPYSQEMYKKHFGIDLCNSFDLNKNYFFNKNKKCILLFIKYENIENWEILINQLLDYKFVLSHSNKTLNFDYRQIVNNLKFKKETINFLENPDFLKFFTENEINKIKNDFFY